VAALQAAMNSWPTLSHGDREQLVAVFDYDDEQKRKALRITGTQITRLSSLRHRRLISLQYLRDIRIAPEVACIRCKQAKRTTAFLPCNHLALCDTCSGEWTASNCPHCNKPSANRIPIVLV